MCVCVWAHVCQKRIKALPQIRYYQPSTLRVRFGVSRLPHCLFCSAMWKMLNINNGFQWCIVEFLYELILPQWKRPRAWTKRLEPEHSSPALPLNGEQRGKAGWRRGREGCSQARPGRPGGTRCHHGPTTLGWGRLLKGAGEGKSEAAGTGGVRKRNREQTMKMMGRPDRGRWRKSRAAGKNVKKCSMIRLIGATRTLFATWS